MPAARRRRPLGSDVRLRSYGCAHGDCQTERLVTSNSFASNRLARAHGAGRRKPPPSELQTRAGESDDQCGQPPPRSRIAHAEHGIERQRSGTRERDAQGRDSQDQRVLVAAVVREEALWRMRAHAGDDHDGERHRCRDRGRQAERQQQAGAGFGETRRQGGPPSGHEAELLQETARAGQAVASEPSKQFLGAVGGQRQADHQAQNQDSDTHVIPSYFLVEWNYLTGSMITISLPDVKGLSFGKCLGYTWHHDEAGGFPMPDVPDCDPGAGSLLECADPQCPAGGAPAVQRALRARQGAGGQGAVGTTERFGSPWAAGASRRGGPTRARDVRADEKRADLRRPRAGDRALGARAHARGEATPAIKHNWSVIAVSGAGIEVGIDSFVAAYDEASLAV